MGYFIFVKVLGDSNSMLFWMGGVEISIGRKRV
jgi:hypothetical protein